MNELIRVMSNDMKIMKYPGESSYCYKARLIYSTICEWMRISTQDKYGESNNSKSKQYLLSRCSEVLNGFLECEPECLKWFIDEEQVDKTITNSVRSIREKMICAGELVEVGDTYAWPMTRYNDKVQYVVSCEVWDLIRAYLNKDLGIEIRERV